MLFDCVVAYVSVHYRSPASANYFCPSSYHRVEADLFDVILGFFFFFRKDERRVSAYGAVREEETE